MLQRFCQSIFDPEAEEIFLIAANDGQLVESWRRLKETEYVKRARRIFEELLVEGRKEQSGVRLKLFNLSCASSAELFDRAVDAFLGHSGWDELKKEVPGENDLFGLNCPIRQNYELLQSPLVRGRLRSLLELCDYNGLHVPIRQILLLLSNAVLGHPDAKDHLMSPADVPKLIAAGTVSKASLYNNVFGGNLSEIRRQSTRSLITLSGSRSATKRRTVRARERQRAGEAGEGAHLHQQGRDPPVRGKEEPRRRSFAELRL